jgi:hypothetical protein
VWANDIGSHLVSKKKKHHGHDGKETKSTEELLALK